MLSLLPLAAVILVAAGCGGGSNGGSSQSSGSGSSGTAGTQTTSKAAGGYGAAQPSTSTASTTPAKGAAVVTTRHLPVGTVLVGPSGRTLYLFEKDRSAASMCSGPCAQDWPPLTTSAAPKAGAGTTASMLATTKRADGTMQVTYAGHPLYYFEADKRPGQDTGQGLKAFGASWYVVNSAGKKIDES